MRRSVCDTVIYSKIKTKGGPSAIANAKKSRLDQLDKNRRADKVVPPVLPGIVNRRAVLPTAFHRRPLPTTFAGLVATSRVNAVSMLDRANAGGLMVLAFAARSSVALQAIYYHLLTHTRGIAPFVHRLPCIAFSARSSVTNSKEALNSASTSLYFTQ